MHTFLFVHGGMLGGWCWRAVRKHLEEQGHLALTPTLTGLGEKQHLASPNIDLDVHITDIANIILYEDLENVILVGHSYGGMVIRGVADNLPNKIQRLIYIDALLPQDGESMLGIVDEGISSYLIKRAEEDGDGWQVPPPPAQNYLFPRQDDIDWVAAKSTPHPLKSFQQRLFLKNPNKHCRSDFIKCTRDHALDPMLSRAKDMHIPCHLIDTGHFPMVTEPAKLGDLLLEITS